jgi:hypothetical protein
MRFKVCRGFSRLPHCSCVSMSVAAEEARNGPRHLSRRLCSELSIPIAYLRRRAVAECKESTASMRRRMPGNADFNPRHPKRNQTLNLTHPHGCNTTTPLRPPRLHADRVARGASDHRRSRGASFCHGDKVAGERPQRELRHQPPSDGHVGRVDPVTFEPR